MALITKLLISGSQQATQAMRDYARRAVERAHQKGWSIIVGDAEGIDAVVMESCDRLGVLVEVHGAKGKMRRRTQTGKNIVHPEGYFDRDRSMAEACTCCLAVWNGRSRDTRYTFEAAKALGRLSWLIDFSKPEEQRMTTVNAVSAETGDLTDPRCEAEAPAGRKGG
jgi:hypothetical protein